MGREIPEWLDGVPVAPTVLSDYQEIVAQCEDEWQQMETDLVGEELRSDESSWQARYNPERAAQALLARRGIPPTPNNVSMIALVLDIQFCSRVAFTRELPNWEER